MKLTVTELKPKKAVIKIEDIQPYFVNSIRRIMLSELPKLAVEDVVIYDNTTALFDEIISHRLGYIPIPTDLDLITFKEQCICKGKGCPSCTVRYTLSKEGEGVVLSGDLQPSEKSWAIKEGKIPIVPLYGDQRLILEVEAVLGKGKDNAKWQPVQAPGYIFWPIIKFDKNKIDDVKEIIKKFPEGIIKIKDDSLELKNINDIATFESYIDKEKIDYIQIERDSSKIIFHFETDGALSAKDALLHSVKILEQKYKEFGKQLRKIK